ncbi:zinc finger BED domain-containing protein RICESLEEPER 3-like [Nicotiana tomentosiformis]|uniref:zinc finger BED domain-containing protein RICESLEEPER 3-like n=1 Tax=Nicotiana tomentosiformis TaxID=4098 RepID=UPI00388C4209
MTSLFDEYVKSHSKDKGCRPSSCLSNSSLDTMETSTSSLLANTISVQSGGAFEEVENEIADSNILLWWKVNSPRFPILAEMARDVLSIPISSVASECAFSTGGSILDSFRSSLTPKLVEVLVCLQDCLRSEPLPFI